MDRGPQLDVARRQASLTVGDLWLRYFALGGKAMPTAVEDYLAGDVMLSHVEHDTLVHALNERFSDLGLGFPLRYSNDEADD